MQILILPILILLKTLTQPTFSHEPPLQPIKIKLIPANNLSNQIPILDRIKTLIRNDETRAQMISQRLGIKPNPNSLMNRRKPLALTDSGQIRMSSAADYGSGQYLVSLNVGSPNQKVVLIADTGSDLTWMNCEYRRGSSLNRVHRRRRVFRADGSRTFDTVPCVSEFCKVELTNLFSLARCPTPRAPCAFDYRYTDASNATGIFANETVTLNLSNGKKKSLHNVLVGCSNSAHGQSFRTADGVLGLGFSKYSFSSKASNSFGGKFSYCLVDHLSPKNVSNYLTFGKTASNNMQFTELVLDVLSPFYAVNVMEMVVGDIYLNIPKEVWDVRGSGGLIVDSGSSLTSLAQPAYDALMDALTPSLSRYKRVDLNVDPMEFCFDSTGFNESEVPRLGFRFYGGAFLMPPVKSYVIDVSDDVKCLGFMVSDWPGTSLIGNIMQQNHLWEFDLQKSKLGFAPSECT